MKTYRKVRFKGLSERVSALANERKMDTSARSQAERGRSSDSSSSQNSTTEIEGLIDSHKSISLQIEKSCNDILQSRNDKKDGGESEVASWENLSVLTQKLKDEENAITQLIEYLLNNKLDHGTNKKLLAICDNWFNTLRRVNSFSNEFKERYLTGGYPIYGEVTS